MEKIILVIFFFLPFNIMKIEPLSMTELFLVFKCLFAYFRNMRNRH